MRTSLIAFGAGWLALTILTEPTKAVDKTDDSPDVLKVADGRDWMFVNSQWRDTDAGGVVGVRTSDGNGLQGYCLAFATSRAYADVEATFSIQMNAGHADQGLIVRAQDPTHYYLIHFPQSGQSYRAQHFWVALSLADGSGYLRIKELAHVRRVASNPFGIAHRARVKVAGDRFQVWVNDHPALDVRDGTYKQGYVGLAGFASFAHGKVVVRGSEIKMAAWDGKRKQVKNWFVPYPDAEDRQSYPISMTKAPNGDLLCAFMAGGKHKLGRSTDGGRSWTAEPAPKNMAKGLYLLRDGRLVSIDVTHGEGTWSESRDNGKNWENIVPIKPSGPWPKDPAKIETGWQLALKDGTLVRFGLGRHSTGSEPVTKWGAVHAQAFAIRSSDGGKTWSLPADLDATSRGDMGNLDLTEPVGFETRDGRIMCLIRPIYSPWMWETWSSDHGKSWTPCVRGPFPGYAPSAPVKTASGVVVFPTRFPGLALHHTRDDGLTWDEGGGGTYIDTSIWAMGSLVEVKPNVILFIYMDSWHSKLRAQFVRVTEHGLEPARP